MNNTPGELIPCITELWEVRKVKNRHFESLRSCAAGISDLKKRYRNKFRKVRRKHNEVRKSTPMFEKVFHDVEFRRKSKKIIIR